MILTGIGEIGVTVGERQFKLRPSLYAMTQVGEPGEIVEIYARVMADEPHPAQFDYALNVIYACCDDDLTDVFGYLDASEGKGFVSGAAPREHVLPLARCLLKHGVTGALPELPRKADEEPEYVKEFDARAHVALAMAHLGMSSAEAWQLTMTELVGAMRAKFPQVESNAPGAKAPTAQEHNATMEWFDKIEAKRKARLGAH